jgi:hypothetical protein
VRGGPRETDPAAQRRRALRVEMSAVRRRVDHRVIRYVDRCQWIRRACQACRGNYSAGSLLLGLALIAATFRFGFTWLHGAGEKLRAMDLRRILREISEAIRRQSTDPADEPEEYPRD